MGLFNISCFMLITSQLIVGVVGEVITLNEENWDSKLREHTNTLVLFYGEHCNEYVKNCKHLISTWDKINLKLHEKQLDHSQHEGGLSGVTLGVIDGDTNSAVAQRFKVLFYPQVIFFHNYPVSFV
jgi:hypothetical protein